MTEVNPGFGAKDNNPERKKQAKVAGSWDRLRLVVASQGLGSWKSTAARRSQFKGT